VVNHYHRVVTAKRLVHQQGVGHRKGVAIGRAAWVHLGVLAVQFILDIAAQVHAAVGEDETTALLGVAAAGVGVDLFQGDGAEDVHVSLALVEGHFFLAMSFSIGNLVIAKPASRIAEYSIRSREISTPSYQAPMMTANTGKMMNTNDRMIGLRRLSSMKYTMNPPTEATSPR